jgi:hypothetical protein
MAYAIARIAKLKGAGVGAADRHVERLRKTPNADRTRLGENAHLIGDGTPLRELVDRMIEGHGGRPRRDSVECVEVLLEASPEYFTEGRDEVNPERVPPFAEKAVAFLRERYGENCVKAVLHMDETTPHVQAFVVPIDERGKLNCKRFFGTRERLREFQDAYARKMEPLGLRRGVRGSRASHTEIQKFYGAIKEHVPLELKLERMPEPPLVLATEASREKYRQKVVEAVREQTAGQLRTIRAQAMLARHEAARREATEERVLEVERRAEERIREAERRAQERAGRVEREAQERIRQAEAKTKEWAGRFFAEQKETIALHQQAHRLRAELAAAHEQKGALNLQVTQLSQHVESLSSRLRDIPLREVMKALKLEGDEHEGHVLYRDARGGAELRLTDKGAFRGERKVADNAVELVVHLREAYAGEKSSPADAALWLSDKFGEERATAALLAYTEQHAAAFIHEYGRTRGRQQREQMHTQQHQHGRGGFSR